MITVSKRSLMASSIRSPAPTVWAARGGRIGRITQPARRPGFVVPPSSSEQPVLVCVGRRRGARLDAELHEGVAHVPLDRPLADEELGRDLAVRATFRDEPQD